MSFLKVQEDSNDITEWCKKMAKAINYIMDGKTNNTGTVTLTENSTTTTVTFASGRLGNDTVLLLSPTTANAASALTNVYVSGRDVLVKTLTLTHSNTASTDRTYAYVLVG